MSRAPLALALALALAGCGPGGAGGATTCEVQFSDRGDVRVFTVTHRIALSDAESYDTFQASFRRHAEQLRPCLSAARPNLLVFPEDSSLVAWFIGRQGLAGRHAGSSGDAFNALYAQAFGASDAYRERFPGISSARALTLAASDRAWRALDRAFGGLAAETGAWVITSANVPVSDLKDRGHEVSIFGDPDADGTAYVARGPELFNAGLLYAPDGSRAGRVDKAYLIDSEEQTLDMSNGPLSTMEVWQLPFGKVGVAISRDAWYPPFAQRLDDLGAELVVQPEAFFGWSTEQHPGDWLPEVMLASGWAMTQKYARVRHVAAPMLTGSLFEIFFDGQAFLTEKAAGTTGASFVGLEPLPGFSQVGPWAFEDDASLALAERRARLRALGRRLLPGSGSSDEGRTGDGFIAADLSLPSGRPLEPVAVTEDAARPSAAVDPSGAGNQRNAAVAFDVGGRLYVTWEDERGGTPRVRLATSSDGGRRFDAAHDVLPSALPQRRPRLATSGAGVVAVAWQEGLPGAERVRVALSRTAGVRFEPLTVELQSAGPQWEPALTFDDDGNLWAAWTDFRGRAAPSVRLAKFLPGGKRPALTCDADASTAELARVLPSQFQPALAALNGNVGLAWVDGRNRDWEVHARVAKSPCDDGLAALRVSPASDTEVLAADPAWAIAPDGRWLLSWDEIRGRGGIHDVNGAQWQAGYWQPLQLSPTLRLPRYRPSPVFHAGRFEVFVQDLSTGRSTVGRMDVGALGLPSDPVRADGLGDAPVPLHHPAAAARLTAAGGVVTFEDTRDGWSRIRALPFD